MRTTCLAKVALEFCALLHLLNCLLLRAQVKRGKELPQRPMKLQGLPSPASCLPQNKFTVKYRGVPSTPPQLPTARHPPPSGYSQASARPGTVGLASPSVR
jgi:hypothetical protein